MELLEYVLRKAIFPGTGGSVKPLVSFPYDAVVEVVARDICPLEEPEEIVSSESVPFSIELEMGGGRGGMVLVSSNNSLAGANNPFLIVEEDLEPMENRPLALGAEATRRRKRDAVAPIDLGVNGPFVRDLKGVDGATENDGCEGFAVCGPSLDETAFGRILSDLVCCRDRDEASAALKD